MNNSAAPVTSTIASTADAPFDKTRSLYWVAVSRGSAGVSPSPLPFTVKCSPTPQILFGLETLREAMQVESIALTESIPMILVKFRKLNQEQGCVAVRVLASPEPPIGSMTWSSC